MNAATWKPLFRYFIFLLMAALMALLAWQIREIFQPLLVAGLMSYLLSPLVHLLQDRTHLPRRAAGNVIFFSALAVLVILLVTALPLAFSELQGLANDINASLNRLQIVLEQPYEIVGVKVFLGALLPGLRSTLGGVFTPHADETLLFLQNTSRGFLWFLVVLVSTYYLLTDWEDLREWFFGLAPTQERHSLHLLYTELHAIWMGYLNGQMRLIFVLSIIYTLAWSAIGLPGALILGPLAGLLNLLPEVGPFFAAALAVLLAWLEGSTFLPLDNLWFAALTLGLYFLLNNIKTIWLQPRILGQSVLLHEGVVFVAIVTAVILWGVLGVLLVVPALASLFEIGRYLRARLLGLEPYDASAAVDVKTGRLTRGKVDE